ncbi:YceD family protein [Sphingomonas quercus]|nr:DUF177 domain-containing protein [Sphingomonas quercus]
MMLANEFARPIRLDTLGEGAREVTIAAEADERAALAKRFHLLSIERLEATAALRREGERVFVEGRLAAAVTQSCVATGDPLPATLDEPFALRFEPTTVAGAGDVVEEVELAEADLDIVTYSGGTIDLGEAVAETLSLALDPFPRAPDADDRLREAGVLDEGEAGPFAALKALKDKLGDGE